MASTLGNYDPQTLEPEIVTYWEKNKVYQKAKAKGKKGKIFYFLDGPPYTSGKVHIGTAWNKALKDAVLRYKRMAGFNVWDRAGYDMHGLPTEHATEKKLGLKGKEDILKFGVGKFVKECEKLCVENMLVMNQDFIRLGVWMDFKNAYQSITKEFIEGEWWLIKKADENKRLYEGVRTMTWCADCASVVAKHELEYQSVKDTSIFLKFPVTGKENEYLVVWTTTPWTIPFNMAVMVNPELEYVRAKVDIGKGKHEIWILAKALAGMVVQAVAGKTMEIVKGFKGDTLEGLRYVHPLEKEIAYFKELHANPKLHTVVLSEEYVDVSAGSGLVHCAPGCGPEDYEVGHRNGLPPFNRVDEKGVFQDMGKFSGWRARADDDRFRDALKATGMVIEETDVEHEYPHCWRCHKPVIFRTTKQWFFKVEDLKDEMIKLNDKVYWIPQAAYNAFNSWLKNLRDNSITKQRYWGTPLPVWKCAKCENYTVVSTVAELEKLSKKKIKELHLPWIDEITIKCSCGGVKERIPDILDVWVDAGCASWNCLDYPQKTDLFKKMFPPDFILEGKDQIRGWFNLLMVASMMSMRRPSFKAVYMHGFVQDALGRKMSKSLGNYILPEEVIKEYGADTFRYYAIGGAAPAVDLNYNFDDMKLKHKNIGVLWNLHKYLIDLSKTIGVNPEEIDDKMVRNLSGPEEKYIISKLNSTIKNVTQQFEEYRINETPWVVEELFLELSRTYIQLVREKAATGDETEKQLVLHTIYRVFMDCLKLFAPIAPFVSERIYLNLREEFGLAKLSIFLHDWPKVTPKEMDADLEKVMDTAQGMVQAILAAREKIQLGVRWPMKGVVMVTADENLKKAVEKLKDLIMVQTNVKTLTVQASLPGVRELVKADYNKIGKEFGDKTPKIIARLTIDSPETIMKHIREEGFHKVRFNGDEAKILREHLLVSRDVPAPYLETEARGALIYLNKDRTPELEAEGYARELMRRVQAARKDMGLQKRDIITLHIKTSEVFIKSLLPWQEPIKEKVGAKTIRVSSIEPAKKHKFVREENVKGAVFGVFIDTH
ncbi:isoleucine--tRNA ligase [Candidatus Woesearchaeota archaeon]|nr:isoleucine--tRNA ligase [Candidatus Woesearchaeota archaeon]